MIERKPGTVGKVNECSESEALFLYLNNQAFRKVLEFIYLRHYILEMMQVNGMIVQI